MNKKKEPKVVPNVRFKGFTDDWKQRKLGKMMNITSVKRIHQSDWTDSGVRFLRARDIVAASKNEEPDDYLYISEEKYEEYSALSGKVDINDLLVTGVGTIGVPYLVENLEPLYFKDGNIIWFKNKNKIDGKFLYYSFIGNGIQSFIKASAGTGTVRTYTIDTGKKTPIQIPSKEEQRKIGEYLTNIDHLITLHQRKIDKLKNLKKAMLEKMFPKKGSLIPEFRFNGFANAWEQRKLGDISSLITKGTTPKDKSGTGEVNFIKVENINDFSRDIVGMSKISLEEHQGDLKRSQLQEGDILFSIAGTLGRVTSVNKAILPANTNQALSIIRLKEGNLEYVKTCLKGNVVADFIRRNPTIGAQPNLSLEQVSNLEIEMPSEAEQEKIGLYFSNLDNLIILHQRKLDMLKKLKSACLSEMFI